MPDLTPDRSLRRPPPPGAREAVVRAGRRRRQTALTAAGAALVLVVAVPWVVLGGFPRSGDRLVTGPQSEVVQDCPPELESPGEEGVAAPPATGPADRLVPDEEPTTAVVCRYENASTVGPEGSRPAPDRVGLEGARELTGGLDRLPDDLALPAGTHFGFCTAIGGPVFPYLLRLDYPSGSVWVSTSSDPNRCGLVTNGDFTAAVYVGDQVAASYDARTWVESPPRGPTTACPLQRTGRAGQEVQLVPDGWSEALLCREGLQSTVPDERARDAADLLSRLPVESTAGAGAACDEREEVPGDDGDVGYVVWRYPSGRDVVTFLFVGCDPPVSNGSLSATASVEQQAELLRLLGRG